MKRLSAVLAGCTVAISMVALFANHALSQSRITTTRQLQVIGAAAGSQSHGAWLVDLQSSRIIFCERGKSALQCESAAIP